MAPKRTNGALKAIQCVESSSKGVVRSSGLNVRLNKTKKEAAEEVPMENTSTETPETHTKKKRKIHKEEYYTLYKELLSTISLYLGMILRVHHRKNYYRLYPFI